MLISIIVVSLLLRLTLLGQKGFWYDEACSLQFACREFGNIFNDHYWLRPVYFVVLHFWTKLFGVGEIVSRFPSVIFSVLAVSGIYRLGKNMFGEKTGMVAALLMGISYYSVAWAQEVRGYSLLLLLSIISSHYFFRSLNTNSIRHYVGYGISSILLILTSPGAAALLIFQGFYVRSCHGKGLSLRGWKVSWLVMGALLLLWGILGWKLRGAVRDDMSAALAFVPWTDGVMHLFNAFNYGGGLIAQGATQQFVGDRLKVAPSLLTVLFLLCFVKGILEKTTDYRWRNYCIGWFVLPIFVFIALHLIGVRFFAPKYLIFIMPAYYLLVARGVAAINIRPAFYLILALIVAGHLILYRASYRFSQEPSWREIAAHVKDNLGREDNVVLFPAQLIAPFWLYFKKDCVDIGRTGNGSMGRVKLVNGVWVESFSDGGNYFWGVSKDTGNKLVDELKNSGGDVWVVAAKEWAGHGNYAKFQEGMNKEFLLRSQREFHFEGINVLCFTKRPKK